MKHYDYIEWLLYKNGVLSQEKSEEMEQHLYGCNTCMEIFLSLIDEKEENSAEKITRDNFTTKVMSDISKVKHRKPKSKQTKRVFNYQFGYYAAVASVTIILTLGGLYVDLVDAVPKISASIELTENNSNIIADVSNKIVDSASSFLLSIENTENNWREKDER